MTSELGTVLSLSDFPEEILINIVSFLHPNDISAFASSSRHFAALCNASFYSADLWLAMCDRRWGCNTEPRCWSSTAPLPRIYKLLDKWEHLIGFWHIIQHTLDHVPSLVLFEWGSSCIIGYRVEPAPFASPYAVTKIPFIWMGLSSSGKPLSYLHLGCHFGSLADLDDMNPDSDIIEVTTVLFDGYHCRLMVQESLDPDVTDSAEVLDMEGDSPPNHLMSEIYRYFSNRRSSGVERSSKRQRMKKRRLEERERLFEFLIKIDNIYPTPDRPLQGLWKGISEDMKLKFYVVYHDDEEISCWLVGELNGLMDGVPTFRTSNTTFFPFFKAEHGIYNKKGSAVSHHFNREREIVCRILVVPPMTSSSAGSGNVVHKIWGYEDGTFGFVFSRNNFIVDMKHVAVDGCLLDFV